MKGIVAGAWLILSVALISAGCGPSQSDGDRTQSEAINLGAILGGGEGLQGFDFADRIREFRFPEDHGAHPTFRNEWWYLTGNLISEEGRRFGYQFTIFRNALSPEISPSTSRWRSNQVYMAHFALSDFSTGKHKAFERFGRGAAGVAGAENPPLRVWLDDWQLVADDTTGFPWRLSAKVDDLSLDLALMPGKPLVLNGDRGLSHKGGAPGNASYYYSMPRLESEGEIRFSGERFNVKGLSWLDREWSTSALAEGQAGWDWFALQLDDGSDLMLYRLRRSDGTSDPASGGNFVDAEGRARVLKYDDFAFHIQDTWLSPETGVRYPLKWQLVLPNLGMTLDVAAVFENQEMDLSVRYWEGAVTVSGETPDGFVNGRGYMELAGYTQ